MPEERLDQTCTRRRQQRLLQHLRQHDCEAAIVTRPEHVQWLCGLDSPGSWKRLRQSWPTAQPCWPPPTGPGRGGGG